jgi:predicted SprT family Zn-dependent metalloprotease
MGALGTGRRSIGDVSDSSLHKMVTTFFNCKNEDELDRKLKSENIYEFPCVCCRHVFHISKMVCINGDYYCKKCGG